MNQQNIAIILYLILGKYLWLNAQHSDIFVTIFVCLHLVLSDLYFRKNHLSYKILFGELYLRSLSFFKVSIIRFSLDNILQEPSKDVFYDNDSV
jgi:hypothetical protein